MQLGLFVLCVLAECSHALPWPADDSCSTTTVDVVEPTTTVTYTTIPVSTIYATTANDLGTWTSTVRVPATSTVATVTRTETVCESNAPETTR